MVMFAISSAVIMAGTAVTVDTDVAAARVAAEARLVVSAAVAW